MTSIEQQTARASEYPEGVPLYVQVASFHGNPHKLLLDLLRDPERPVYQILDSIGIAHGTYWSWRGNIPAYAATVDAIRSRKLALRREAALAIIEAHTIPITEKMIARAEGDGRDAQRAGERLLETVSVLQKEAPVIAVVDPTRELLAELRRHMAIALEGHGVTVEALPETETAERAIAKVLGPGTVVLKEEDTGNPS